MEVLVGKVMKNIILGILVCISAVFTVYYLYDLNQTYIRAQTKWNDVAQRTFREAVDIEVNQINDTPIQFTPGCWHRAPRR